MSGARRREELASARPSRKAAQYLRMSKGTQDYSIEYQEAAIADYARRHGLTVEATYCDEGVSGVGTRKRQGLNRLLADVLSGRAPFEVILTYDVSRWGRFQDPDEAAHYEFLCVRSGVRIEYCAEPFADDDTPTSALVKHLKRVMAAEFSRDLSEKVRRGQLVAKADGYWTCSAPGYGLRRQSVSRMGEAFAVMGSGEWQKTPSARTRLAMGPEIESAVIHRIYREYLTPRMTFSRIARALNADGIAAERGALWTIQRVRTVLTNPKYVGDLLYGRWVSVLGKGLMPVDPSLWRITRDAVPIVVTRPLFDAVQAQIAIRRRGVDAEATLEELRKLLARHGYLSNALVRAEGQWSPTVYVKRFGSLSAAFAAVGFTPTYMQYSRRVRLATPAEHVDDAYEALKRSRLDALRRLYERHGYLSRALIDAAPDLPSHATFKRWFGSMTRVRALVGYDPSAGPKAPWRQAGKVQNGLAD